MIFVVVLLIGVTSFAQNRNLKIGAFGALPIGDTKEVSKTGFGLDATYLFEVSNKFDVGFATGLSFFKGEKVTLREQGFVATYKYKDAKYIPITGVVRFNVIKKLYLGADIGYAVGIGKGIKGGFHYKPRIGYRVTDLIGINTSFTGLKVKNGTWNTINFGIELNL
ncbi:hypothetical protein SAMN05421797_10313 [Maribacter ulvicola]|uniref:Outer membrane protein beta-barrel domain-containing protein n=2 Tax=Maribacter ulvicola TaxID=228959 RepID=A0A1N6V6M0_9FLAO|nr:hypothetical protein SAMN05421797_10313 [Maribacter ulvicola]